MIRNIIFDMGNVLLRFDPEFVLSTYLDNESDRDLIRRELYDHPDWMLADQGILTEYERYEHILPRIPQHLQEGYKNCALHWHICLSEIPGAKAFLAEMKQNGYKLYVLSNADDSFHSYFPEKYDVALFDGIIVSSDIRMIKPDRCIYEYFLREHGLAADECLFIDDRPENIEGAGEVGIRGHVFTGDFETVRQAFDL